MIQRTCPGDAWTATCARIRIRTGPLRVAARSLALAWAWTAATLLAQTVPLAVDLREAVQSVPAAVRDALGREFQGEVLVTTFRPRGAGPFPLAVISHGRDSATRAQAPRPRFEGAARYLVRKGFAVAVPQRIGYGELASLGDPESSQSCENPQYRAAADAAADQVLAVVRHLQAQPDIDPSRLLLVGQSVGGLTTVAAAARRPPGLLGAINFAGGHGGNPKTRPGEPCKPALLERLMGELGATAPSPMLWIYAENDRYFSAANSRRWADAFNAAGGRAKYQLMPAFGEDGHLLFARGADQWQPVVEGFLNSLGLAQPGIVPRPPASGFAAVDDLAALPLKMQRSKDDYAKFLAGKPPRAWAIGPSGRYGWAVGDDALSRALGLCQRATGEPCKLYAVDDDVVWIP